MTLFRPSLIGLLVLIAVYVTGGWALAFYLGIGDTFSLALYSGAVFKVTIMLFFLYVGKRLWSIMWYERPKHLTLTLVRDIKERLFTKDHLLQALPIFIGFILFMAAFTNIKAMIPLVQPFGWDETFAAWDRALHFGLDPWRILQTLFGHAWITSALNIVYNLWFVVMFAALYWQLFDLRRADLRMRFFWTFFLTWMINGSLLAIILSSAGPCFYGSVVSGGNPYADQMAYLSGLAGQYPVWAVATQQMLWEGYQSNVIGLGSGISAMPSVHVAIATLLALLAWQYGHAARLFFIAFAACIMIGSVHLAWHYAIDGYVGALVTVVIWFITGKFFPKAQTE